MHDTNRYPCRFVWHLAMITAICWLVALNASTAGAVEGAKMKPHERAALPDFCFRTAGFDKAKGAPGHFEDLKRRYGQAWSHLHHYCWALGSLMRYNSPHQPAQKRKHWAGNALRDIDYVLQRSEPSFVMWYTIMKKKTRVLVMVGDYAKAAEVAGEMKRAYPERASVYGLIAEIQLATGNKKQARETIEQAHAKVEDKGRLEHIARLLKID